EEDEEEKAPPQIISKSQRKSFFRGVEKKLSGDRSSTIDFEKEACSVSKVKSSQWLEGKYIHTGYLEKDEYVVLLSVRSTKEANDLNRSNFKKHEFYKKYIKSQSIKNEETTKSKFMGKDAYKTRGFNNTGYYEIISFNKGNNDYQLAIIASEKQVHVRKDYKRIQKSFSYTNADLQLIIFCVGALAAIFIVIFLPIFIIYKIFRKKRA
ncbi:MAG: hypothetical protein HRT89_21610, partial [Lentisphaeria bacterium]|nr:hypothetical protein [Lentisphaeria bacterium]